MKTNDDDPASDDRDGEKAKIETTDGYEVGRVEKTIESGTPDLSLDLVDHLPREEAACQMDVIRRMLVKASVQQFDDDVEQDEAPVSPCSPASTRVPSTTSFTSSNVPLDMCFTSSSSSSPVVSLSPPLPPSKDLWSVLTQTSLVLDVYQGGAGALTQIWSGVPEDLKGIRTIRLGSEDQPGLDSALSVLPNLTLLTSVSIRGNRFHDSQGDPLPGLLTCLPSSFSRLSLLVHLDLSFNQLSSLPTCLLSLPLLSILLLCCNRLAALPHDIDRLSSLTSLSVMGNKLVSLPPSVGALKALKTLCVSNNHLQQLPNEIGGLEELTTLDLSNNNLKQLPETMGSLLSLRNLVISSNNLRQVPNCLTKLPLLKMETLDNPFGKPPTPPPLPPAKLEEETKIPELHIRFDEHSFSVTSAGCHVFLPGGSELLFPPGCLQTTTEVNWAEKRPYRKLVHLEEHEILLSCPLELQPHGIKFLKPVQVCVSHRRVKKRDVVVRRFDGQSWSTLPTVRKRGSEGHSSHPGGRPARLACCTVLQFSWFMAVACPMKDTCSLTAEKNLLVSSFHPGIKLHFLPDSTIEQRTITLEVVDVAVHEVRDLCGDPGVSVSPLLCLSQSSSADFLRPIKVQLPLPPGVTGRTLEQPQQRSCLHVLHGDPVAQTWIDITSSVSLTFDHLYAFFYITHFSWYWLWYTTKTNVCGVVRKIYQKLKLFKVQFLVLQRKSDPFQVLVQCLPSSKVESRLQSLSRKYDGPQPTDQCDLLEGEQFFAGFEKGLDISSDRPDCMEGRLSFVFYSSMDNVKEICISPAEGVAVPVRGQVSFYRGEMPEDLPEEVSRTRRGPDNQWLATLPLKLPAVNSENNYVMEEFQRPLNLGDPETGFLTETNLLTISHRIGPDWRVIGFNLGLSYQELNRMEYRYKGDLGGLVLDMLFTWARRQENSGPGALQRLVDAMEKSERKDIADEIEDIVNLGREKYNESIKRVGLEGEGSSRAETRQQTISSVT
ncbi:p53-induced death domain-containing protein 1 isoform 2-T2 [Synchiropus picturatus]